MSDEGMTQEKQTEQTGVADAEKVHAASGESVEAAAGQAEPAAEGGGLSDAELVTQLREELAAAEAKAADYLDRMQRTAAEYQNSRRRMENQVAEETERANAALLMRLLPVLDDFRLAFQNASPNGAEGETAEQRAWLEGFRQIQKKLTDTLGDYGLVEIRTEGEFDPTLHEAISSEPNETVPSGHVIETLRAGYEFKGRVLRPALVRVAM